MKTAIRGGRKTGAGIDRSLVEELLFGGPELDSRRSTARLGSFLYYALGLVILGTMWSLPEGVAPRRYLLALALESMIIGLIIPRFPWERWSPRAYLIFVALGFALMANGNYFVPGVPNPYDLLYIVLFAFIGLTQAPGTGLIMFPVAMASYVVPEVLSGSEPEVALVSIAIAAPIWVLIAETLSRSTTRLQRAEYGAGRLLDAGTTLAHAESEQETAALVTGFVEEFIETDSTVALVAGDPLSSDLENLGQRNFSLSLKSVRIDPGKEPWFSVLQKGKPSLVANARSSNIPETLRKNMNAASLFFLPLMGEEGPQGLVIAAWGSRRSRLDRLSQRAAELISSEAGHVLERIRAERRLEQQAETDALTSLSNRRGYARALAQMQPGDAVVLIDLDHFKQVNDTHGHAVGDQVLRELAGCMKQVARWKDSVTRYGGEEFALILRDAGDKGAEIMCGRLREIWEDTNPITTFSAGVAVYRRGESPDSTVARADQALYRAKELGRNRTEVADHGGQQAAVAQGSRSQDRAPVAAPPPPPIASPTETVI